MLKYKNFNKESIQISKDEKCAMCKSLVISGSVMYQSKNKKKLLCPICMDVLRKGKKEKKVKTKNKKGD